MVLVLTLICAALCRPRIRKEITASRFENISSGRIGSASLFSTSTNKKRRTTLRANRAKIIGWVQGSLTPPSSSGNIMARIMAAKIREPLKSIRLHLLFLRSVEEMMDDVDEEEQDDDAVLSAMLPYRLLRSVVWEPESASSAFVDPGR